MALNRISRLSPAPNMSLNCSSSHLDIDPDVKLIGDRLYIDGFLYTESHVDDDNDIHWKCRRCQQNGCQARAVTSNPSLGPKIILRRGIDRFSHNHLSSVREIEEAEIIARFEEAEKCDLQPMEQLCSHSGTLSETELQVSTSPKTVEKKKERDESVTETESKQSLQVMSRKMTYCNGLTEYALSTMPPRVINQKLHINGFKYTRGYSYVSHGSPKTYWQCKRYTKDCSATAITCNPDLSPDLIVYKGPTECRHTHSPTLEDVQEAEKVTKCHSKMSFSQLDFTAQANSTKAQLASSHISNFLGSSEEIQNSDRSGQTHLDTRDGISTLADSNDNHVHDQMCVKLIGKRLFINGYIYVKHSNGSETSWICRRYRKTGCDAKAFTSDPSLGKELSVYKVSNHDHPTCELEVEEAELQAKLHLTQLKLESSQNSQSPIGSNDGDEDAPRKNLCRDSEVQSAVSSSVLNQPPQSGDRKNSSIPRSKISNSAPRLIGKRLYIDGYIYFARNYGNTRINWNCRSYGLSQTCSARAITSNYLMNRNLVVYKGPDISKHNHPPSLVDLKKAENRVKFDCKIRKPKSKPTIQVSGGSKSENFHSTSKRQHSSSPGKAEGGVLRPMTLALVRSPELSLKELCRIKRIGHLRDDQMYRQFLVKFSENPIFDQENVMKALEVIYSSREGRKKVYVLVLENRKKIERDLNTLKNNPNATITALKSGRFLRQDESVEEDVDGQQLAENNDPVNLHSSGPIAAQDENAVKSNIGQETGQIDSDTCSSTLESPLPMEISKSQEHPPLHQKIGVDSVPPVPATVTTNVSTSESRPLTVDNDGIEVKQEIIFIDLTDDSDQIRVKQESVSVQGTATQPNQIGEAISTQGNPPSMRQNFDSQHDVGPFGVHQPNHYQNQWVMPPNCTYPIWHPAMYHALTPYNTENFNFNAPAMVNDGQMPWLFNATNPWNNVAVNPELFAQSQPHHQFN